MTCKTIDTAQNTAFTDHIVERGTGGITAPAGWTLTTPTNLVNRWLYINNTITNIVEAYS